MGRPSGTVVNKYHRHCNECGKLRYRAPWGLCQPCYKDLEIRKKHVRLPAPGDSHYHHEPTMEELDALIAEQSKNLPDWWWNDWEKEATMSDSLE